MPVRIRTTALVAGALLCFTGVQASARGPIEAPGKGAVQSIVSGEVLRTVYDGVTDDLLTGGLGRTGIASPVPPAVSDPPTAAELRRLAIYNNYRALVDPTEAGGFGRFYGPNVAADGTVTNGEGLVAGVEYIAFAGKRSTSERVTLMVQIPETFDPAEPCIVTGPSSGSRGVYGAIGTSGEWGLKNGCAVAYTDKGTGTGAHDLQDDTVNRITGERADADAAGRDALFTVRGGDALRAAFNAETPNRFAFKHAHSQSNPEARWGMDVLQSVEFAFWALNREYPSARLRPGNTIVIASSVSNGGGASVLAAEQDRRGLIDGIAVSEPNVNPTPSRAFGIQQGEAPPLFDHSRDLLDYTTLVNLYQGCANLANPAAPFVLLSPVVAGNRCTSLQELGLLQADTVAGQAAEAQAIINDFGILEEQNVVQPSHYGAFIPQAIAVTYANAYARSPYTERLCGYTFGATTGNLLFPGGAPAGEPVALPAGVEAVLFSTSNGIPPTAGVNLINDNAVGGPRETRASVSVSTGRRDHNVDGALCTRSLATGRDPISNEPLRGRLRAFANRAAQSVGRIRASGDLGGRPAIFVTGRSDAILPPNHTSRAYFGLNRVTEGAASGFRYVEVLNAQHLDAFNAFPGFDTRFVPLHHYFIQALDRMLAHLRDGTPLPPSQVVRTTPRGGVPGGAPPLTDANLAPIVDAPAAGNRIRFDSGLVRIPE
jgi:hydroxybutyrate-dimer hydrolase